MEDYPAYSGYNLWEENQPVPERKVFQSIIIQAIKDYVTSPEEKQDVREWVRGKSGTFRMCAISMGIGMNRLQQMMLRKLNEVDKSGEREFKYSRSL